MSTRSARIALVSSFLLVGPASAQITRVVSSNSSAVPATGGTSRWPSISADGLYIAFESDATNLVTGDTNGTTDIFLNHTSSGNTTRMSRGPNNAQLLGTSSRPSMSADARYIAYVYRELAGGRSDVVVYDRLSSNTVPASVPDGGTPADADSGNPAISGNGRYVAFTSTATNLVPSDASSNGDCFLRDRLASLTTLVSCDSAGVPGNGASDLQAPAISEDGRSVVFASSSTNLDPADASPNVDLFLRDTVAGTTELLTVGNPGGAVASPSISADGRYVAFATDAPFDPADTNGRFDVYVRDRLLGIYTRASVSTQGSQGSVSSRQPAISADGRFVAFESVAPNLVPGDTNGYCDVFVRDLLASRTTRASISSYNFEGNADSLRPTISEDGTFVAFQSAASNLAPGDTNSLTDVLHHDTRCNGGRLTYCTAKTNSLGCVPSITSRGTPSRTGPDNFTIGATQVRNRKLGILLWSHGSAATPFFGGTLCVAQPFHRTAGQDSGGSATGDDCTGVYSYSFTQAYMAQHSLGEGTTLYAQFWMRDPGFPVPNNIGLTNGMKFTICP